MSPGIECVCVCVCVCVCKSVSVYVVVIMLYVYSPGSYLKESPCSVRDLSSVSVSGRFPGVWNDHPPQEFS